MRKRNYVWFVEPLDKETNESIATALQEDAEENLLCITLADKKQHHLWRVPFDFIKYLQKSKDTSRLSFRVYNRVGNGQIRQIPFSMLIKHRKPKQKVPV